MEESTSSEHLSHVQWDTDWKACVMLGIESLGHAGQIHPMLNEAVLVIC